MLWETASCSTDTELHYVQPTKENKYVTKRVYHFHRKPVMTTYVLQTHADWRISL